MSSHESGGDGDQPRETSLVGYGRPPVDRQFKRGAPSANPYGRGGKPRLPSKNDKAARKPDFLDGLVTISVNGKPRQVTRDEAIDHVLFKKAAGGDVAASRRLDERQAERRRRAEAQQRATAAAEAVGFDPAIEEGVIARALDRWQAPSSLSRTEVQTDPAERPSTHRLDEPSGGGGLE